MARVGAMPKGNRVVSMVKFPVLNIFIAISLYVFIIPKHFKALEKASYNDSVIHLFFQCIIITSHIRLF